MKQTWATAVIVGLFACTAALSAQYGSGQSSAPPPQSSTPSTQSTPPTQGSTPSTPSAPARTARRTTSRAATPQAETITVTGCVQDNNQASASASAATTRSTRAKANPLPSFALSNVSASAGGSTTASAGNGSYVLQGMDLTREIGQQVEVTATVMPERASRTRARGTSGSTSATPDENQGAQHLWVSSVKMISPTCSGR